MTERPDVLLLSLGTTLGWRIADDAFRGQLERAGAATAACAVRFGWAGRLRRGYPANDLIEAHAARRALRAALARHRPRAVVISTTTAAMLAPDPGVPYAVRLDAPAALNRPGRRNAVLRVLERRALSRAPLLLPSSRAARAALADGLPRALVVPPPIAPSGPRLGDAERLAVAYVPDPKAKGLEVVCAAWSAAEVPGARLAIFGVEREVGLAHLERMGVAEPRAVDWRGWRDSAEFRTALRRSLLYVGGAHWEDFGQAPLEALADGALLATVPSGGPFEALELARRLEPRLVADSIGPRPLAAAIRAGFDLPDERVQAYRRDAAGLLAPYSPEAVQRVVELELLPALLR